MKKVAPVVYQILKFPMFWFFIVVLTTIVIISPKSLSPLNLLQVLKFMAPYGIISIGQTCVILTGCVDLSTGPLAVLSLLMASGLTNGEDKALLWAIPLLLVIGCAFGLFNALLVIKGRVEPMVGSLVTASIVQGCYLVYTGGAGKGRIPPILRLIGTGRIGGFVPVAVIIWLTLSLLALIILRKSIFGRSIYYVGSNRFCAYLSGISVNLIIVAVYLISGLCSVLGGLVLGGYIGIGTLQLDVMDYSFTPLIITLLGGTDFVGAKGGIEGTIVAVFAMGLLLNVVTIIRIAQWGKYMIQGVLILAALVALQYQRR